MFLGQKGLIQNLVGLMRRSTKVCKVIHAAPIKGKREHHQQDEDLSIVKRFTLCV